MTLFASGPHPADAERSKRGSVVRIGFVVDHPSPHMASFLDALAEREDCAVEIVYLRDDAVDREWGVPRSALPHRFVSIGRRDGPMRRAAATARVLGSARADIWVINSVYTTPETWVAARTLRALGVPWVYMNEPLRPRGPATGAKESLMRLLLSGAAGVIGMGDEPTRRYRALNGEVLPTISVPYYVQIDDFLSISPRACDGPVRFFSAGQLIHRKGFDVLCAATELLPRDGWSLTIAGGGPLRAKLESAFRTKWPAERVHFLGAVPFDARTVAFAQQDVFVFPSRWDGWGMAPVEALAAGLPVIATDQVMSMHDFIVEGQNGFVVPANDASALADRMRWFIDNRGCIPFMSRAARNSLRNYRPDLGADRLVAFLTDIEKTSPRACRARALGKAHAQTPTWGSIETSRGSALRHKIKVRTAVKSAVIAARSPQVTQPHGHRILAYHLVLREDRRTFGEHLKYLRDNFTMTTAEEIAARRNDPTAGPMAAVTFDDTFRILLDDALELLHEHGIKATFYAPTGFVERAGDLDAIIDYCRRAFSNHHALMPMSIEDIQTLRQLGHEIGSHGVNHLGMSSISVPLARRELRHSQQRLTTWLGASPSGFAYPYGDVESSLGAPSEWVSEAGYRYAVTMLRGDLRAAKDSMLLPREHVEGNWPLQHLRYFLGR